MAGFALTIFTGLRSFIHPAQQSNLMLLLLSAAGQLICLSVTYASYQNLFPLFTQQGLSPPPLLHRHLHRLALQNAFLKNIGSLMHFFIG